MVGAMKIVLLIAAFAAWHVYSYVMDHTWRIDPTTLECVQEKPSLIVTRMTNHGCHILELHMKVERLDARTR
jgi:hypothetical protein